MVEQGIHLLPARPLWGIILGYRTSKPGFPKPQESHAEEVEVDLHHPRYDSQTLLVVLDLNHHLLELYRAQGMPASKNTPEVRIIQGSILERVLYVTPLLFFQTRCKFTN